MTRDAPTRIENIAAVSYRLIEDTSWAFERDQSAEIEAHWQKRLAQNPQLFNGRVLLMHRPEQVRSKDGCLEGTCFATDYKAFLAWRDFGCPDACVANLFAMAALRSADGAFLLGEMGAQTANAGRLYFPAGTPDLADLRDGRLDLEGSVWRELKEETGFNREEIDCDPGWTVVFHGAYIACMKTIRLHLSAAEASARVDRFLAQEKDPELSRLRAMFSSVDFDSDHMPEFMRAYLQYVWRETG
jgi:hypothetical protein